MILLSLFCKLWFAEHALKLNSQHAVTFTIFQATYDLGKWLFHVAEHLHLTELRDFKIDQVFPAIELAYLNFLVFVSQNL